MSFLTQRLHAKRGGYTVPEYQPPIVNPEILPVELGPKPTLAEKLNIRKYEIGETKPDIVDNIIEFKPPVASVRKALRKYIEITEAERDDF